jgi:aspartate kinase
LKELNFSLNKKSNKLSFVISTKNIHSWNKLKKDLKNKFERSILINDTVSAISIIGEGFSRNNNYLLETIKILKKHKIDIFGITTTSFRISLLIKNNNLNRAIKILHKKWID